MKKILLLILISFSLAGYAQKDTTKFRLNIRAGINNSFFKIEKKDALINVEIENDMSPRVGLEFEYVLPFNKLKWSAITEVYYQRYNYSGLVLYNSDDIINSFDNIDINYQALNLLLGIKYHYAEYGRFKSYLAAKVNYAMTLGDAMINFETLPDFEINSGVGYLASLGFVYNKKISFEFEYSTRPLVDEEIAKTRLNTLSFLLAYKLM